jgi:hypothetical protein
MAKPEPMQFDIDPNAIMRALADGLDHILNADAREKTGKPAYGFVLLVAEFNKMDGGRVNYISNGQRDDMLTMLREFLARVEGRAHDAPRQRQ